MTVFRSRLTWGLLLACGSMATTSAIAAAPEIKVLSSRADLVSGNSALVEIKWPAGTNLAVTKVAVGGVNAKNFFSQTADGRYMGVVTGLKLGANMLTARAPGGGAQIALVNHPIGGPVFSGPQIQPWICAQLTATPVTVTDPASGLSGTATTRVSGLGSNPVDAQCNAAPRYTYYYMPKAREGGSCVFTNGGSAATRCFEPYPVVDNPGSRPPDGDIADFTNDRGVTVKALMRVERGAMNRGIYDLVSLYDPAQPSSALSPQKGWNQKLLWSFGGNSSLSHFQSAGGGASGVWDVNALRRGYMTAVSNFTDHGTNLGIILAAEMLVMVKDHIAKNYGEIRFTVGLGCSGGSIMQHSISSMYPGLLDGLQPSCSFPDSTTTNRSEVVDCGILQNQYYTTANGSTLTTAQRGAINGHGTTNHCAAWIGSFLSSASPTIANNCGSGFPAALVFHPTLRPNGIRCTFADRYSHYMGSFVDSDGFTKALDTIDNVGVQYGLKPLQQGVITPEDFVRLNEGVGSYNNDFVYRTNGQRAVASEQAMEYFYKSGWIMDGRQIAKVPVIAARAQQANADVHLNWRAWQVRERLKRDTGSTDNYVIWAYTGGSSSAPPAGTTALAKKSLDTMDAWLTAIEADTSSDAKEVKVVRAKPAAAVDFCLNSNGATEAQLAQTLPLDSEACAVKYQGSPHQAAGGSITESVLKCSLKPLNFSDPDFQGVGFTEDQKLRLHALHRNGVCDWSKRGIKEMPAQPWRTYATGVLFGAELGAPPKSQPIP